jgi:hypothetical protein
MDVYSKMCSICATTFPHLPCNSQASLLEGNGLEDEKLKFSVSEYIALCYLRIHFTHLFVDALCMHKRYVITHLRVTTTNVLANVS